MRSSRILALSFALIISVFLAACGGGGGGNNNPTQPLTITSTVLTQATVNEPYTFILQGSGGSGTYTWAIISGSLPKGLMFTGAQALINGTPTQAGKFTFTAQVTDSKNDTASQQLTLDVTGAISIACNSCAAGTLNLPAGTPGQPYTATFAAMGGIAPYTWCVQESSGTCDNGSGGALPAGLTIDPSTGTISGTPTTPQSLTPFTIQATDSESPQSSGTAQIMLSIFGVVTASLPAGEIYVPYGNQQLSVAGGTAPYSWCVRESNGACDNGSGGAMPPGITMSPACLTPSKLTTCTVSGTPTAAGTFNFTVQTTDSEMPPAVATAAFSIDIAGVGNGALNGNYIFDFIGYKNGQPVLMVGAFTADGNGNITAGEIDYNSGSGETNVKCALFAGTSSPQQQTIMPAPSSTYSIGGSGIGLGTLTLVTSAGTYSFTVTVRQDGSGNLIQDNSDPATRGSGSIRVQTPNIGVGQLQANFALGQHGADPSGNRYVAAGQLAMEDNQGDLKGPALDVDDGGTSSQHIFAGTLQGNIDSFGRGCNGLLTFDSNQKALYNYVYYVVNEDYVVMLSTDPVGGTNNANLTLWSLQRQIVGATGFNNGNLATPTVLELQAQDTNGNSDVTAGLFVGQGSSSHTCQSGQNDPATFTYDENAGGTLSQKQSITGQYCVDKSTGRVTLTGFTGIWAKNLGAPVFYLGGNDPGFVVGTDAANTSGALDGQSGSDFSNASVGGGYWGGTISPAASVATDSVTSAYADANGNFTGTQYISAPGGPAGPTKLTYTYTVDSTGRGVVESSGKTVGILYVVAPTGSNQFQSNFVLLPTGNNPVLNLFLGVAR